MYLCAKKLWLGGKIIPLDLMIEGWGKKDPPPVSSPKKFLLFLNGPKKCFFFTDFNECTAVEKSDYSFNF